MDKQEHDKKVEETKQKMTSQEAVNLAEELRAEHEDNIESSVRRGVEPNIEQVQEMTTIVKSFDQMRTQSKTKRDIYTTLTDQKIIFNLEDNCDCKLNDCVGEKIRVKDILIKRFEKPLEEPEIDEQTGEILKDKDIKMITILIDESGKSYVTASKMFGIKFMNFIGNFGQAEIQKGLEIEITKQPVKNSPNQCLSFKLL